MGVPTVAPMHDISALCAGNLLPVAPEMMTDDAKFALGF
jgi:hypothetical protein